MAKFVNPKNTQRADGDTSYSKVIAGIAKAKECPFCPKNLAKYHQPPILGKTANWIFTDSMYPYKGTASHVLVIHKKHLESPEKITVRAWKELHEVIKSVITLKKIRGASLLMRFGDTEYTGASVNHLHFHIITGGKDSKQPPIFAKVGQSVPDS